MASDVNLVPITGLTFAGTSLMRDDGVFLMLKKGAGEIPSVRGVDTIVPGLTGRVFRNRVADRLVLELEGYVQGQEDPDDHDPTEPEAYYDLVDELVELFDPAADPAALSGTWPDGSIRSIDCRVVAPLLWDEVIHGRLAKLNVALESVSPAWDVTPPGP
jgi:hypothetical protein